jgi:hypothetical protein
MDEATSVGNSGKAEVTLRGEREIVVVREFDAPKELVYRAYTTPELIEGIVEELGGGS